MTRLVIDGNDVTLQDGKWSCPDPALLSLLDSLKDPLGPSGATPDPDLELARRAVARFGGRIASHDAQKYDPSVVY